MSIALNLSSNSQEYEARSPLIGTSDLINGLSSPAYQSHWYFEKAKNDIKPDAGDSKKHIAILGVFVILVHGFVLLAYINRDKALTLRQATHQVEIEFINPAVEPPPNIEPPKPQPKVVHQAPPPAPQPAIHTHAAEQNIPANTPTIQDNTNASKANVPVVAASEPTAPAEPKAELPVIEATGNAAYLNNPPPEYPAFAQRQGWEGLVLLRVYVLASGKPDRVEIKQSSSRNALDEAALNAVKNWTFVPSKRGNTAIDGWATVPIEFKLGK